MPIEIRELVIKTTIDNSAGGKGSDSKSSEGGAQVDIVQECVEQVMELLNKQKER